LAPAGHREIDVSEGCGALLELALPLFDGALERALECIRVPADALALVGRQAREGLQDLSEGAGLTAEKLSLDLLEPSFVCVRDLFEIFPQRV
jgi:hypothetical protein